MRIVIDMQGAQTESRFRGIGRYTMGFTRAVVKSRGEHEIILALSGLFPDTIEPIRAAFDGLMPQENIRVWHAPGPVRADQPGNDGRRETAEILREGFLASLQADMIHICSLFEGYVDDAVTSIGRFDTTTPVSTTIHDLIPLFNPDHYFKPNPRYELYYQRKIEFLKKSTIYLAVSESARQEGIAGLGRMEEIFFNTFEAVEPHFQPQIIEANTSNELKQKYGIHRPFVLYTGGSDERKNLSRLIEAYAAMPTNLRDHYQLVFAGKMPEGDLAHLRHLARKVGLKGSELLFIGYVSDQELVLLYNLCELYVFPSWHEGFGLPALEAMACGAPVISANASSMPEVIGLPEALFDPFDVASIKHKIRQVLEDESFRANLHRHGLKQAKKFSWEETARRAIRSWERLPQRDRGDKDYLTRSLSYHKMIDEISDCAYKYENEKSLIQIANCIAFNESASCERQLFLDISELCRRDNATGVQRVVRSYLEWLLNEPPVGYRVEPIYATFDRSYRYARQFTLHFMGLNEAQASDDPIRWQRGDVFFGLDMQHHVQLANAAFYRKLQQSGVVVKFLVYDLLPIQFPNLFKDSDAKKLHEQWLSMIAQTDGAICISKATADAFESWIKECNVISGPTFYTEWVHIGGDIEASKPSKGIPEEAATILAKMQLRPTFLCVSTIEPRKRQQQILEAFGLLWAQGFDVNLVFVGQKGWKTDSLIAKLCAHSEIGSRLFWLSGISDEYLVKVYTESSCLIAASLNEGFGLSLIEAARHGLPIIARDIPVFHEVAGDHATYFQGETAQELSEAVQNWLEKFRYGKHPSSTGMSWSTWQQSAEKLKTALVGRHCPRRQLLVDISELVQRDARTGIQRVVRSILKEWLTNPSEEYRVEPVYATTEQGYHYARRFIQSFLNTKGPDLVDELIDYAPGDVFFVLDLQPQVQIAQRAFYQTLRRQGIRVQFLVHDLLCVLHPQYFLPGAKENFGQWLSVVSENDGAVCVSKTVADDLTAWIKQNIAPREFPFKITWFHLGADGTDYIPTLGLPSDAKTTLRSLKLHPTFLMVGTIEPRKGHAQVLDAFERLWQKGVAVNLVIVGKQGWMVRALAKRLRNHPALNQCLFWLEGISDEYLGKVYDASTCMINASYAEGFGLPLIEAARHKLPIIARDIPVFHEVAGEHAFYFDDGDAQGLEQSIEKWLNHYREGRYPKSVDMLWLTWRESAEKLKQLVERPNKTFTVI